MRPCFLRRGKQLSNRIERLEVGHRVRSRGPADRRLIDEDDIADELGAFELPVGTHAAIPVPFRPLQRRIDDVVHERALPRAAHPGHAGQEAERNLDVNTLQIVLGGPENPQALRCRTASDGGHRNGQLVAQILGGKRPRFLEETAEAARIHDAPPLLTRTEPHVDDHVGNPDGIGVMLHDQHGVPLVAQLTEDRDQPFVVAGVQSDGGFVEHVERVHERRPQ